MKTKFLKFIAILLILAVNFSAGCHKNDNDAKMYATQEGRADINETEYIKMYLSPESVSVDKPMKLIIENHTKNEVYFNLDFDLQYLDGNNYTKIQDNDYEPKSIIAGATIEIPMDLYSLVKQNNSGKLGNYRIIRKVSSSNYGNFILCADFEINEKDKPNNAEESPIKQYLTKEGRFEVNENEFVSMYILPEICSNNNTPIKWIIKNNTQKFISFGTPYSLEYFDNGNWVSLTDDYNWTDIGLGLFAGSTREEYKGNFSPVKNSIKAGKYKIIKRFALHVDNTVISGCDTTFNLYTEYEIK